MRNSLIIFDLDGTLIDSRADLTTACNLMRADYGLPSVPVETATTYVGNGVRKFVERATKGCDVDIDEGIAKVKIYYGQHMVDRTTLYPGVVAALESIAGLGYKLALVTNKPEAPARKICAHFGMERFFDLIVGGDSCASLKPHPEPLYLALRETGCGREGSWVIGDNHTDLAAGRNAGLPRCFCTYGFGELKDESYDLAVDSLAQFAEHLM